MKIKDVARIVTLKEGKKKSVAIGQVREIMAILNKMTAGAFYKLLRQI